MRWRTGSRCGAFLTLLAIAAGSVPASVLTEVVRSGFVEVPGGKIHYEASGTGPHLVLIGGGSAMDLREWDDQFMWFARRFQVIRWDPRGFGQSGAPTGPFSPSEDLRLLLDRLRVEKVHLVGLSFGGRIAIDFTLAHPERVSSLVLVSPTLGGYVYSAEFQKRRASFLAVLKKDGVKDYVKAVLDDN